jgi:hypothetical protein
MSSEGATQLGVNHPFEAQQQADHDKKWGYVTWRLCRHRSEWRDRAEGSQGLAPLHAVWCWRKAYGEVAARASVSLERWGRVRGARASFASIAANSFSMARADGAPSISLRRMVSASSSRTSS